MATPPRTSNARAALAAVLVGAALTTSACGGGEGGNTARFCNAVSEHSAELFGDLPTPLTATATRRHIDLVNDVGASAPLEIEADWDAWALTLEAFYSDPDIEHIKAMGYASQKSALAIDDWLQANCGAGVGVPIGTLPAGGAALAVPPTAPPG